MNFNRFGLVIGGFIFCWIIAASNPVILVHAGHSSFLSASECYQQSLTGSEDTVPLILRIMDINWTLTEVHPIYGYTYTSDVTELSLYVTIEIENFSKENINLTFPDSAEFPITLKTDLRDASLEVIGPLVFYTQAITQRIYNPGIKRLSRVYPFHINTSNRDQLPLGRYEVVFDPYYTPISINSTYGALITVNESSFSIDYEYLNESLFYKTNFGFSIIFGGLIVCFLFINSKGRFD